MSIMFYVFLPFSANISFSSSDYFIQTTSHKSLLISGGLLYMKT
jgi:hypothetical protein